MAKEEKITPVTEDEADNIRVTIDTDDGPITCKIAVIFDVGAQDYIALIPLDKNDRELPGGEVYLYRYREDENGLPSIDNITDDEEYDAAADRFDELLDEEYYDLLASQ